MGQAIILVCSFVGVVIIAFYVLVFSASALLVVVEGTAGGNDEINWPHEPWADVFGRAGYLAALLGLWLIPAGFLSRGLAPSLWPDQPLVRTGVIVGLVLWLFFPFGLLSALRSVSGWAVFRFDVLRDLLRVFPATALFYTMSGLLAGLVGFVWLMGIGNGLFLLLAAPLTAIAWLIYARLLGRLAFKMASLPAPGSRQRLDRSTGKRRPVSRRRPQADPNGPIMPVQEPEPEPEPIKQSRGLLLDDEPEPYALSDETPPERPDVVPLDGYDPVEAEEVEPPEPGLDNVERANRAIANRERRLTRRRKPPKLPERPMVEGILTFPFYPQCLSQVINLAFGWLLLGCLLRMMFAFSSIL